MSDFIRILGEGLLVALGVGLFASGGYKLDDLASARKKKPEPELVPQIEPKPEPESHQRRFKPEPPPKKEPTAAEKVGGCLIMLVIAGGIAVWIWHASTAADNGPPPPPSTGEFYRGRTGVMTEKADADICAGSVDGMYKIGTARGTDAALRAMMLDRAIMLQEGERFVVKESRWTGEVRIGLTSGPWNGKNCWLSSEELFKIARAR